MVMRGLGLILVPILIVGWITLGFWVQWDVCHRSLDRQTDEAWNCTLVNQSKTFTERMGQW
jgi:hypothetical protein